MKNGEQLLFHKAFQAPIQESLGLFILRHFRSLFISQLVNSFCRWKRLRNSRKKISLVNILLLFLFSFLDCHVSSQTSLKSPWWRGCFIKLWIVEFNFSSNRRVNSTPTAWNHTVYNIWNLWLWTPYSEFQIQTSRSEKMGLQVDIYARSSGQQKSTSDPPIHSPWISRLEWQWSCYSNRTHTSFVSRPIRTCSRTKNKIDKNMLGKEQTSLIGRSWKKFIGSLSSHVVIRAWPSAATIQRAWLECQQRAISGTRILAWSPPSSSHPVARDVDRCDDASTPRVHVHAYISPGNTASVRWKKDGMIKWNKSYSGAMEELS